MSNFNVELWNIHQLCVLHVLNEKETIPTRKIEKLASLSLQRNFMLRQDLNRTNRSYVATGSAMSQQRSELKPEDKALS